MNLSTPARRLLGATAAPVLIACLGATGAQARGIQLFPHPQPHRAHAAKGKHRPKTTGKHIRRGPRGPQGPQGVAGPQGPVGPTGAQGPAGPGAFKFGYYDKPTPNNPMHAVLSVGPFLLSVSCLPGENTGDVGFKVEETVPAPFDYTQTLETLSSSGTQAAPELTEGEQAVVPPTAQVANVANGKTVQTWATLAFTNPATGATTWLELWYGAKATATPVCYMSGIEV